MRQRLLFEGELSDVSLENVFPTLISKAIEADDAVFLRCNGATIRVEPTDTIDTLLQKYDKEIRLVGLANKMEMSADQPLTEQAAYDEYQERSKTSGDRAEQLAWAMIVLLAGQLIGGSKYAEFYVLGGAALLYLLLSTMQYVWQSVTIWLVKRRIKRTGIKLNDYPGWVGFGAWVFYWLKMIIIALGAIYGASHFISFAM
jgi:hypothetical protein